jgi:hypothetical protein
MRRHLGWICVVAVLGPPEAQACKCVGQRAIVLPVEGSTVPTNLKFLLAPAGAGFTLSSPIGVVAVFPNPRAVTRVAPPIPLVADTAYTLSVDDKSEVTNFRTGAGPDNTPPTLTDFTFSSFGSPPIGEAPCGTAELIVIEPTAAADDATPADQLHYDFFFGATPGTVDLSASRVTLRPEPLLGAGGCSPNNFPLLDNPRIAGALAVVDLAGNRSMPTQVRVLKGCGCASTSDALPFAALGLMLAGLRPQFRSRQRRRLCG